LFGGLKMTWEVWGTLARMFGWKSRSPAKQDACKVPDVNA
jgi:hypothetical protein